MLITVITRALGSENLSLSLLTLSLEPQQISLMGPTHFAEKYVRIFCKDMTKVQAVNKVLSISLSFLTFVRRGRNI